jgi:hypothetical protein
VKLKVFNEKRRLRSVIIAALASLVLVIPVGFFFSETHRPEISFHRQITWCAKCRIEKRVRVFSLFGVDFVNQEFVPYVRNSPQLRNQVECEHQGRVTGVTEKLFDFRALEFRNDRWGFWTGLPLVLEDALSSIAQTNETEAASLLLKLIGLPDTQLRQMLPALNSTNATLLKAQFYDEPFSCCNL